jgi:hypothetical protein
LRISSVMSENGGIDSVLNENIFFASSACLLLLILRSSKQ